MSKETLGPGEEMPEFGGFNFSSDSLRIAPLTPDELEVEREQRIFQINAEGNVITAGYSVSEITQLFQNYREHMIEFARGMQRLSQAAAEAMSAVDSVRYRPDSGRLDGS